jgi:hypothetical protein
MEEDIRRGRGLFCAGALRFAVDYVASDDDLSPPGTGIIAEIEPTNGGTIPAQEGLLVLEDGTQYLLMKGLIDKWVGKLSAQCGRA